MAKILEATKNIISKIVIKSKTVIEGLSKKILRHEGGHVISVSVGKKFAALETMMIPGSGLTQLLKPIKDAVVKAGGNTSKVVKKFFPDIMYVQFVGNGKKSGVQRSNIIFQGVWVKHDGRHTRVLVKHTDGYYWDLLKHCAIKAENVDIDEYIQMIVIGATPSMLRKKQILMGNAELPWVQYINKLSYGALKMKEGMEGTMDKLNKLFSRMFHMWAPHKYFGTAEAFAFYNGEWVDEKGNPAWDGLMFIAARAAAKWVADILKVEKVDEKAVLGMGMQCRPDTNKAFGSVVNDDFIRVLMKNGKPVYRFEKHELTKEVQKQIWNDPKYKDAWIIVGKGRPDYVSDRNALKAEFDLKQGGRMVILAFAKYSVANTSIQMLSKVAAQTSRETFLKLVQHLFVKHVDKKLESLKNKKPGVVSVKEAKSGYILGIIDKIAPNYVVEKDQQLFKQVVATLAQALMKASNRLKFEVDGGSLSLMSDIAYLLTGERVIYYGEFFAPYANRYYKDKDGKRLGTIIKYPSVGIGEFYQGIAVPFSTIKKRVNKLNCSKEVKAIIINWFACLSDGVLVVPCVELLKQQLAGLDFDFDGCTLVLDPMINEVMATIKPIIVDIDPGKVKASEKKYPLAFESFHHVLRAFINSASKSVGEITVMNDTVIALMNAPFEQAKTRIMEMVGVTAEGKGKFIGLPKDMVDLDGVKVERVRVSPELVDEFVANLRATKITEDNYKAILSDIVAIFRYYQEGTIDSVKTGIPVEVAFEMKFVTKTVRELVHEIRGDQMAIGYAPANEQTVFIPDVINDARILCARGVKNRIVDLLSILPEYNEEDMALFEIAKQGREDIEEALVEMKLLYNNVTGSNMRMIREFEAKGLETDGLRQEYKKHIAMIGNMVRRITKDLSPVDRALLTKAVAMSSKAGTRADGGSKFATVISPEYIHMIARHWGETGVAGTEIIGKYEEGDVVEFVDGQAEKAISVNEPITGTFTIKKIDGKLYATKLVSEVVEVPEVDDTQLVFRLHSSARHNLDAICETIERTGKVRLTANRKERDTLRDLDGNVICRISCEGRVLSNLYNDVIGDVAEVNVCSVEDANGNEIRYAFVVLNNIGAPTPVDEPEEVNNDFEEVGDGEVW